VNALADVSVALVQLVGLVLGGPVLVGLMRKVRARLEGREGARITQPLADLRKLLTKQRVRPDESSWVFAAAPVVLVATTLVVGVLAPLVSTHPPFAYSADFFAVVLVLLVGSVFLALGALDTGTAFGGMGSSRAMTVGALAEPALLVAILALSIPARTSNLPALVHGGLTQPSLIASPPHILALLSLLIVILAESGRLPVDNPATHLELTMIHEAMVLEYAGPDLALVSLGESMRLAVLLGLFVNLSLPWGIATGTGPGWLALGLVALAAKVALVGAGVAVFEVFSAKLRLFRLPELLAGSFLLAVLAAVTAVVIR